MNWLLRLRVTYWIFQEVVRLQPLEFEVRFLQEWSGSLVTICEMEIDQTVTKEDFAHPQASGIGHTELVPRKVE